MRLHSVRRRADFSADGNRLIAKVFPYRNRNILPFRYHPQMNLPPERSAAVAVTRMSPSRVLFLTAWISAFIFGIYIVVFYGGAGVFLCLRGLDWTCSRPS